jgi:hypothetical protein
MMGEIVTVNFRGDQLYGFRADDGVFVALKPIVEAMGMDWSAQYRRVQRDPILHEGIAIMATPFGRGGDQETICIKMELVNGWLFTIDSSRIKDDAVREKVILYQRECYSVLHNHFAGKKQPLEDGELEPDSSPTFAERLRAVTEARQTFDTMAARQMWMKMHLPVVPAMLEPQPYQPPLFDYEAVKRDEAA